MAEEEDKLDVLNTSADFFANSSTETVTENVFPPPPVINCMNDKLVLSPNSNNLLDEFLCETSNVQRLCCPFCIFDFGFEYILKEHIKGCHPNELKHVLKANKGEVGFYQCPFCEAKFLYKELLPKHVMRKHELCVVNMFSGFSPEKYVYCRFCPHKIMRKHYKLLMIHIEKKHSQLFEKYVVDKYANFTKDFEDLSSIELDEETVGASPGLSLQMTKLNTNGNSHDSPQFKSILKPRTAYPIEANEKVDRFMLQNDVSVLYANLDIMPAEKRKTRRKLRFDLPGSPEDEGKENIDITPSKKKKLNSAMGSGWLKLLKSKKHETNEDITGTKLLSRFKCGVCSEGFSKNSKLTEHIKKSHKGISLQAQYCCGDCDAKFYKNSFLRRHSKFHHSPLCLKSSFVKDNGKF